MEGMREGKRIETKQGKEKKHARGPLCSALLKKSTPP